jgi:hypothetical protein
MRAVRLLVVLCLVALCASCSLKPTWDIAGKWQKADGKETMDFSRSGMVTITDGATSVTVPYRFADAKRIEIPLGSLGAVTAEITIAKDKMTITDAKGKKAEYKKVIAQAPAAAPKKEAAAKAEAPAKAKPEAAAKAHQAAPAKAH